MDMEYQIGSQGNLDEMSGTYESNKGQFRNLPFLKGFASQKKAQSTGQPPKRRGPKPDSKPAQTRRQELNRQAQRTHRERKEQYVRALENEVSRLREGYSDLTKTSHTTNEQLKQALQAVMEENKILQHILRAHNIAFEHEIPTVRNMFGGNGGGGPGGMGGFGFGSGQAGPSNNGGGGGAQQPQNQHQGASYQVQGGQQESHDGDVTMHEALKQSTSPSMQAPSMTADNSASPESGKYVAYQEGQSTSPDLYQRQHSESNTGAEQASTLGASTNTAVDTSMASLDPNLSLSLDASTASTSILQPPPEEVSMMSYHATMPLPPLTAEATYPTLQSGASSTLNEVGFTGLGSHWDPSDQDEFLGAVPGVFEKDPQLEMDFVLILESPCRNHMEFLNRRATNDPEQEIYCGHALMATCPPPTQIANTPPGEQYPVETYDLPRPSISKLLNLSRDFVDEGQITPIMALKNLKYHAAYTELTAQDIRQMINDLSSKIRCYGFGAVIEDFEFSDSLNAILSSKRDSGYEGCSLPGRAADRYKQMFAHKLAAMNAQKNADGRYIGAGGVAGPGMPQVDEFLFA